MAGLAMVRALSIEAKEQPKFGRRVTSSQLIDRMHTIPEDELPCPSPGPSKTMHGYSFTVDETTPLLTDKSQLSDAQSTGKLCLTIFLSIMTVLSMVMQVISIPLYTNAMSDSVAGSDAFIASFAASFWTPPLFLLLHVAFTAMGDSRSLKDIIRPKAPMWVMLVVGLLGGVNNILVAFTSIPARTPAYLQGILHQLLIPFTAIARYFLLEKGINRRQFVCVVVQFVALFITLEPMIFGMRERYSVFTAYSVPTEPNPHAWYFYVVYAIAWLPLAFGYVLLEKSQRTHPGRSLAVTAWIQFFQCISHVAFFWVDFIPNIGMANSGGTDFLAKINNGFQCFYGSRPQCSDVSKLAVLYIMSYASTTVFSVLLIRFADGAVFTVVVMALVTPLTTLFWNLFSTVPEFHWEPFFDHATVLILVGLCLMMPAVILYTYFADPEVVKDTTLSGDEQSISTMSSTGSNGLKTRRQSDPIPEVHIPPHLKRPRTQSLTPKLVPYKSPEEVPLRYRESLPPRRPMSRSVPSGILPPVEDKESKRKRKLSLLQNTKNNQKSGQFKRVRSAPVLMGGF